MENKLEIKNWNEYVFDKADLAISDEADKSISRTECRLLRGKENLLNKVWKSKDQPNDEERESIRQEIRSICSNWLKMQNVSVLMGAGASKCILGFVGSDIYKKIKAILAKRDSLKLLEEIEKTSSDPKKISMLFEDYLSQLTAFKNMALSDNAPLDKIKIDIKNESGKLNIKAESLEKLLLDIERAIIVMFNVKLPNSALSVEEDRQGMVLPHEAFLTKLVARDPQQGRARIFTTNYDTLIEQTMDRLGILYSDGFTGTVQRRFNPAAYDLDYYYPGDISEGNVKRYDKVIQLYKLHGSINWYSSKIKVGDPFGIYFDSRPLPNEEEVIKKPELLDYVLSGLEMNLEILPVATKYGETLNMPYAHLFRFMFSSFKEPQTVCFIIGYRGWDRHINRIIEDSLTNPSFNCVIVDPCLSEWAKGLLSSDHCGRIYAFEGDWGKFENFAINIMPDVEILKTDLMIAKTMRDLQSVREKNI